MSLHKNFIPTFCLSGLIVWVCSFACSSLQAQIRVDLQLDRQVYIAHEAITGKLSVVNNSGRDLIFGESNGRPWLDFAIHDARGNIISPIQATPNVPAIRVGSGQTHTMRVIVNDVYPMSQIGTYRIKASVNFPQIRQAFRSREHRVQVTEGQVLGEPHIVGVPPGYPGAGTYRIYELLTYYHGQRQKALYFRLKDQRSGRVRKTFSIGDYLAVRPPQHKLDRSNQLHIVHMAAPQLYFYTVIDLDGEVVIREKRFEKNGNRPMLVSTDFGEVQLRGGISEDEAQTPYERREFRLISERPPGMPQF